MSRSCRDPGICAMGHRSYDSLRVTPWRWAQSAAWVRSVTPICRKTLVRCAFTVFSLIPRRPRDQLVREALGDQARAPRAPDRRARRRGSRLAARSGARVRPSGRAAPRPARRPRSRAQLLGLGVLEQVAGGARVERAQDSLAIGEGREHDDCDVRLGGPRFAASPRFRPAPASRGPSARRRARAAAHSDTASSPFAAEPTSSTSSKCREELREAGPDDGVVVGDQHADHAAGTSRRSVVPSPGVDRTLEAPAHPCRQLLEQRQPDVALRAAPVAVLLGEADAVVVHLQPTPARPGVPTRTARWRASAWRSTFRIASPAAR